MSILLRTDVSAVKLFKEFILAGIGSSLHVFYKTSNKLLQKLCLKGQKIYGFVPSEDGSKILIFGGKQFTVLSFTSTDRSEGMFTRLFEPEVCDDWLHSAIWMENDMVALLTAHNVIQIWNTSEPSMNAQYPSRENSILYSGLLLPLRDDVLVLAGTVFSEVIVHTCKSKKSLHYLKGHRGVIFSISCNPQKKIIVTTSDDRSVRIWSINSRECERKYDCNTIEFWQNSEIVAMHEIYGHTARVMRSCIINDIVISVGEDSAICLWDFYGKLLKKIVTHQNGGIWSVDADEKHLITGGGDSGVMLHPLTVATETGESEILQLGGTPKKIVFTARRNIILLNEKDELIHYDSESKIKTVHKLEHESSYKLLSLSSCKQMIAVVDMTGNLDVFVENCKQEASLLHIIKSKLEMNKILSMHWAGNRHLVLCSEGGKISVVASRQNDTEFIEDFMLPPCKERWVTASAINLTNSILIVGDRCGNIHIYAKGCKNPVKSFSKVHGRYGPTSIIIKKNEFMSTGRDGTIKQFNLNNQDGNIAKYMNCIDLEFQWVEKFIDKNNHIVCGFQERIFVVYDIKKCCKLLEIPCGGGHRTWDVVRYFEKINDVYAECVRFAYVKNADIHDHTFELSKIVSSSIVNGSHFKEINCLKIYKSELDEVTFCISGGEDTTVRVSSVNCQLQFQDEIVFKHLSNVRTLKLCFLSSNSVLLVTAGGRAQICIKILEFLKENDRVIVKSQDIIDYLIKGTEKERKGKQTWKNCSIDFDPETRIMDVDLIQTDENNFIIFAGCSDASLRIFYFNMNETMFKLLKEIKHHTACILKTHCIKFLNKDIVLTCTTRGEVNFFDVTGSLDELKVDSFFSTTTNKSGINSLATRIISHNQLMFVTAGDDNAIHMNLLEISDANNLNSAVITQRWCSDKFHCSQITGILLLENVLVCTSIDQRVTAYRWWVHDDGIKCEYLSQTYSDVADIQGMDLINQLNEIVTVCIFGKGLEIIEIATPS